MRHWTWATASCRGTSHVKSGVRRQDATISFVCPERRDTFISVVSDGAGSAKFGGEGANLVCRTISQELRHHFKMSQSFPGKDHFWEWTDLCRDRIDFVARSRRTSRREFAATLVCAISDGQETFVAHIGDGACVTRDANDSEWNVSSWPEHGEYASMTSFVTDENSVSLRFSHLDTPISAIACFSDGIERMVIDFTNKVAFQPFFRNIARPVDGEVEPGISRQLSRGLASYLDSDLINSRSDDDKTLVLSVLK